MKTQRSYDAALIRSIIARYFADIAEDGFDMDNYWPDVVNEYWLQMTVNKQTVALYPFERKSQVMAEVHAFVLPHHRRAYGMLSSRAALEWMVDNFDWCMKIQSCVPVIYRHIKIYSLRNGFKAEGIMRKSYLKDGQLIDRTIIGITRDEIKHSIHKKAA